MTISNFQVPRQWLGLARQLRREVAADEMPALLRLSVLLEPTMRRLAKKPALRPDKKLSLARAWRDIPQRWRLVFAATETSIIEYRLTSGVSRPTKNPDWLDLEDGFLVLRIALRADKRHTSFDSAIVAFISLHAVARWLARNRDNSEAALLRDLVLLATTEVALSATLRVPTSHGAWVGRMIKITDTMSGQPQIVRAARSFISTDMEDRPSPLVALAGNRAVERALT